MPKIKEILNGTDNPNSNRGRAMLAFAIPILIGAAAIILEERILPSGELTSKIQVLSIFGELFLGSVEGLRQNIMVSKKNVKIRLDEYDRNIKSLQKLKKVFNNDPNPNKENNTRYPQELNRIRKKGGLPPEE